MSDAPSDHDASDDASTRDQREPGPESGDASGGAPPVAPLDVQGRTADDASSRAGGADPVADWVERFRGGGAESILHLWGKLAFQKRKQRREAPWFHAPYEFERTAADWVADCLVTGRDSRAWIEFVVNAEQRYRAKTRAALRFGYPIYWVILDSASDARRAARDTLILEFDDAEEVSFGTFDPASNTLDLGDPVTFADRNAVVPVFVAPQNMTGGEVRAAVARIEALPFDPAETDPLWVSGV